jgi:hypothetical protein
MGERVPSGAREAMTLAARVPAPTCCQNRARSLGPRAELRAGKRVRDGRRRRYRMISTLSRRGTSSPITGAPGQLPGDEQPA